MGFTPRTLLVHVGDDVLRNSPDWAVSEADAVSLRSREGGNGEAFGDNCSGTRCAYSRSSIHRVLGRFA